jgi:hypothetical protein
MMPAGQLRAGKRQHLAHDDVGPLVIGHTLQLASLSVGKRIGSRSGNQAEDGDEGGQLHDGDWRVESVVFSGLNGECLGVDVAIKSLFGGFPGPTYTFIESLLLATKS